MDLQLAFNIAITLVGALGGWVLKWIGDSLKSLRDTNAALSEKVQHIEVLIAGNYARRDDLDKLTAAIFTKLDRIENKLDSKQDKG